MELNIELIKELIDQVDKSGLSAFNLETEGFRVSMEKPQAAAQAAPAAVQAPATVVECAPEAEQQQPAAQSPCGNVVTSPIVGTFYASASPEKPAYVKVGQQVRKGDVLFIVESMKLMNEITSECDGTVDDIFVKDGQSLEYGQPVMRIV